MPRLYSIAFVFSFLVGILQCTTSVVCQQFPLRDPSGRTPILDDEFSAWIEKTGKGWGMKGIAVTVVRKRSDGTGWMTEAKGYGVADRWGHAVDSETLFSIGSNSKLFTALAVGMLTENASVPLIWHSKIKDVVPSAVWGLQDKIAEEHANIVDILSHRTGLPGHDLSYSRGDGLENTLSKLRYLRPSTEFRHSYQYNNQMYSLASYIVSHMTNTSFVDYVTRTIISPLGLSSTTYNVTWAQESHKLADGFVDTGRDSKKGEGRRKTWFRPIPFWNRDGGRKLIAGAGGVISNAKDLAIWLQALLLEGVSPTTGEPVIPSTVVNRVAQGVVVAIPVAGSPEISPMVYGMGQRRYTYQGHELIEHQGGVIGQYSVITRAPHDDVGVAVLTNWDDGDKFMQVIRYRILEKALGLPAVGWNERFHKLDNEVREQQKASESSPGDAHTTSVPTDALAGLYFNPAYGTLELCMYPSVASSSVSQRCAKELPDELRTLLNSSKPVLVAAWPKVWSTHLILRHDAGDRFTAVSAYAFPAPFPPSGKRDDDETRPFAVTTAGRLWPAQFVIRKDWSGHARVEGMAWTGMWEAGLGISSPDGKGKEGAEVWFDRVA